MIKPINGTWFEFQHHNTKEGIYWNPACEKFSAEQWKEKVKEIREAGMTYIVLMASSLNFEAYFDTDIYPKAGIACGNPIEVLLSAADEYDMKVFIGTGFYGVWNESNKNMSDSEITKTSLKAVNQMYKLYGDHKSLYGWYLPDETCIDGYFSDLFINYINIYSRELRGLNKEHKILIAPYGTRMAKPDDHYIRQLESLDVDMVAYQDEIGVQKTRLDESAAFYEGLKKAHDKAGRSALWADLEVFKFEGEVYYSALLPADFARVEKQLEAVSPYVDEILIYQFQGMMNKPGSPAFAGHPSSTKLYTDYMEWRNKPAVKPASLGNSYSYIK